MIIAIHGTAGSGKTTLARMISARLSIPYFDMGAIRKQFALDHGMTLEELNTRAEQDPESDNIVDEYQRQLPGKHKEFVITCRAGFHFIPGCVSIYLQSDYAEAGRRVFKENRENVTWNSAEEASRFLKERDESDARRFRTHYGLDIRDLSHYDLVLDTTALNPLEKMNKVLEFLRERGLTLD